MMRIVLTAYIIGSGQHSTVLYCTVLYCTVQANPDPVRPCVLSHLPRGWEDCGHWHNTSQTLVISRGKYFSTAHGNISMTDFPPIFPVIRDPPRKGLPIITEDRAWRPRVELFSLNYFSPSTGASKNQVWAPVSSFRDAGPDLLTRMKVTCSDPTLDGRFIAKIFHSHSTSGCIMNILPSDDLELGHKAVQYDPVTVTTNPRSSSSYWNYYELHTNIPRTSSGINTEKSSRFLIKRKSFGLNEACPELRSIAGIWLVVLVHNCVSGVCEDDRDKARSSSPDRLNTNSQPGPHLEFHRLEQDKLLQYQNTPQPLCQSLTRQG